MSVAPDKMRKKVREQRHRDADFCSDSAGVQLREFVCVFFGESTDARCAVNCIVVYARSLGRRRRLYELSSEH